MNKSPSRKKDEAIFTPLTVGLLVVVGLQVALLAIVLVPRGQTQFDLQQGYIQPADVPAQTNEYRKIVIQVVGGFVVGLGLYLTYRRIAATERQADASMQQVDATMQQAEASRQQVASLQEGQITERFTNAIKQLGDERLQVRLGGIYALERIANDSNNDHSTVLDVLCAFVREESPVQAESEEEAPDLNEIEPPRTDVQATLTVLGRLNRYRPFREQQRLNLEGIDASKANLGEANLTGANLTGANLDGALLKEARLNGAYLSRASLDGAYLIRASLDESNLIGALLKEARLNKANLNGANLKGANLTGANLNGASLAGSNLIGSNLIGSNLIGSNLDGANLYEARLMVARLTEANLIGASLDGASLDRANLNRASLNKSSLDGASLDSVDLRETWGVTGSQLCSARSLKRAQLPEDVEAEVRERCPEVLGEASGDAA